MPGVLSAYSGCHGIVQALQCSTLLHQCFLYKLHNVGHYMQIGSWYLLGMFVVFEMFVFRFGKQMVVIHWVSWFLGFKVSWFQSLMVSCFGVSWFHGFKVSRFQSIMVSWLLVSWFRSFLVSSSKGFKNVKFHVFRKILIQYSRFQELLRRIIMVFRCPPFHKIKIVDFHISKFSKTNIVKKHVGCFLGFVKVPWGLQR